MVLLLLLLLQMLGGPLQGHSREDMAAYLSLLQSLAEAMAPAAGHMDRRNTILADLQTIILNF